MILAILAACRKDDPRPPHLTPPGHHQTTPPPAPTTSDPTDPLEAPTLVETRPTTPLGLDGRSLAARIQPRGRPTTWQFELGETEAYGATTPTEAVPPKIGAYYREDWDGEDGLAGWAGGLSGTLLYTSPDSVAYAFPGELDSAHADGVGANILCAYAYTGDYSLVPWRLALAGGDPDLRGARLTATVHWANPSAALPSELVPWVQSTPNVAESADDLLARWSNWAYTGAPLTEAALGEAPETVTVALDADPNAWTYAGHYVAAGRDTYVYVPIDTVLGHANGDVFLMQTLFEYGQAPSGLLAISDFELAYRQENVLAPSNGGHVVASAWIGPTDRLTDGWRNGAGRVAQTGAIPSSPAWVVWQLDHPVAIDTVQIHQDPDLPIRDVRVEVSDGTPSYDTSETVPFEFHPFAGGRVPQATEAGPNFAYLLLHRDEPVTASYVRVTVDSAYDPDHFWGVGEIEAFGTGAVMETDDDWVSVTADVGELVPGATYHWRVVAESAGATVASEDATFTVPDGTAPWVVTEDPARIGGAAATFVGRVDPLGFSTNYRFEYGPADGSADLATGWKYAGLELTPRTVTDVVADLVPGTEYRVRLAVEGDGGEAVGDDVTFVAE